MRKHFPNTCFRRRSALTVLATIALADIANCDDVPIDVNGAWGNAVVCGLCKNVVGQWEAHLAGASPDEVQAGFRMEKGNRRILAHDELAVVEMFEYLHESRCMFLSEKEKLEPPNEVSVDFDGGSTEFSLGKRGESQHIAYAKTWRGTCLQLVEEHEDEMIQLLAASVDVGDAICRGMAKTTKGVPVCPRPKGAPKRGSVEWWQLKQAGSGDL